MQPEGVNCLPVVVDLVSLGLLKGESRLHKAASLLRHETSLRSLLPSAL